MSLERLIKRAKKIMALAVFSGAAAISGCSVSNNKFEDLPNNVLSKIAYDKLNMESSGRFFKKDLEKILNAQNESGDIAVILLPKSDYNNAFTTNYAKKIFEKIVKNYRTFAYEIENDEQVIERIREVGQYGQISFLMICGHGQKNSIELDVPPNLLQYQVNMSDTSNHFAAKEYYDAQVRYDNSMLDISDVKEGKIDELSDYLKNDAIILLSSCSVGEGGYFDENFANVFSHELKIRKNCKVFASKALCSMGQIYIIYDGGKIKNITIRDENNTLRLYNKSQVQR